MITIFFEGVTALLHANLRDFDVFGLLQGPSATIIARELKRRDRFKLLIAVCESADKIGLRMDKIDGMDALTMTLRDYETIAARDIYEGRMYIAVAANNSGRYVDNGALRFANGRVANSSAANATIGRRRIRRFVANMRLRYANVRLATRYQMDARRGLLTNLTFDMRYAKGLYTAR